MGSPRNSACHPRAPGDAHREWARQLFTRFHGPFHVSELVLAEVSHLTGRDAQIAQLIRGGHFLPAVSMWSEPATFERCLAAFPHCDLADASVITASERWPRLPVLTTDRRHFVTYRRADSSPLPLELPQ